MSDKVGSVRVVPVGLREPWQWIQPHGTEEILSRLRDCFDLNVHPRERENMCSVAYQEIKRLSASPPSAGSGFSDSDRMDFLERMEVTVKGCDLLLVNPPRLRAAIDVALEQEDSYVCPIHGKIQGSTECPRC